MKKHLIFSLLGILTAVFAQADVVYEPLIVDSGFNRDVIAESTPVSVQVAKSYLIADTTRNYWSMATKSVIRTVNTNSKLFTEDELISTAESGWPDDYRDTIKCIEDAKNDDLYKDVFFLMAPYDKKQVLTIRPFGGMTDYDPSGYSPGIQNGEGTLKFKKVGCYNRVFFLIAAAKEKGAKDPREVKTIVHYTNGDTTQAKFQFGGLSGAVGHNVRRINIYESQYRKNTHLDTNNAFAMVFDMPVNPQKLISRIEFKNELVGTAVMIFAVTGRTADIAAPEEEEIKTSNITDTSFEACWDAIADAASYRLDVAEDPDFQHILEDYNNKVITGATCTEVANLVANNDYYWRVRSVNSEGGQSASSAPRRVMMMMEGNTPQSTDEEHTNIEAEISPLLSTTTNIRIHRTLYKDGCFNTICLPFSLDADGIAASPLAGCQLYTFDYAEVIGDAQLDVHMNEADAIVAGVPYLIKWANTGEVISYLQFNGVTITTVQGQSVGEGVKFIGNVGTAALTNGDHHLLFVGDNNTLYWPNTNKGLKGFRAHFAVPASGAVAVRRNIPARIVVTPKVPTAMKDGQQDNARCTKELRNGQVLIIRDGKTYNILGQPSK